MIGGPKHISGFSAVYQGKLYIVINYCTAFGFDVLGNVEDISIGGVINAAAGCEDKEILEF